MPYKLKKACCYPGCPNLSHDSYCPDHKKVRQRFKNQLADRDRGTAAQRGYDAQWRRARVVFLNQHPLCVKCEEDNHLTPATVVDHIIDHKGDYELFWDRDNWQSLCKPCHDSKTAMTTWGKSKEGAVSMRTKVTIVCGAPGSGKTTYVEQHMKSGDLIIDLDWIWKAFTGLPYYHKPSELLPFVMAARDAVLQRLDQVSDLNRAFIIAGAPKAIEREALSRRYGAKVILFTTSQNECIRRIQADERRSHNTEAWKPLVQKWWNEYQPRKGDVIADE